MSIGKILGAIVGFIAVVFVLTSLFGSWYTVPSGSVGVLTRNNAYVGLVQPGLGWKMPIIDKVAEVWTQSQTMPYKSKVYSKDQQPIDLAISVTYSIPADTVKDVFLQYQTRENLISRILDRRVNEQAEIVFGKYSAPDVPGKRAQISLEISNAIKTVTTGTPILISSVQLENVDFSDAYEQSVEARMLAEIEVQKAAQNADRAVQAARQTVTEAQANADSQLAVATAKARAIELTGNAEASAINARGKALRENQNVVALVQAEKWDGKLPTQMIPGSAVPFLSLTQAAQ